jgi:hypothetical protein
MTCGGFFVNNGNTKKEGGDAAPLRPFFFFLPLSASLPFLFFSTASSIFLFLCGVQSVCVCASVMNTHAVFFLFAKIAKANKRPSSLLFILVPLPPSFSSFYCAVPSPFFFFVLQCCTFSFLKLYLNCSTFFIILAFVHVFVFVFCCCTVLRTK